MQKYREQPALKPVRQKPLCMLSFNVAEGGDDPVIAGRGTRYAHVWLESRHTRRKSSRRGML